MIGNPGARNAHAERRDVREVGVGPLQVAASRELVHADRRALVLDPRIRGFLAAGPRAIRKVHGATRRRHGAGNTGQARRPRPAAVFPVPFTGFFASVLRFATERRFAALRSRSRAVTRISTSASGTASSTTPIAVHAG